LMPVDPLKRIIIEISFYQLSRSMYLIGKEIYKQLANSCQE